MARSAILFSFCSVLMAAIFAYSASVQLNDPDWYFWFPLYACASTVNMVNRAISSKVIVRQIAKVTLWLAIVLFLKVVIEDFIRGKAGFFSLNLSERIVREKTGSGLVIISMILQLEASSKPRHEMSQKGKNKKEIPRFVEYGMAILVSFSFGLPFIFFVVRNGEIKFDNNSDRHS
ncbi:transmembrane protein 220 [Jatropha curcas]|uniref:transmembrane protein 220 n=1 Tax=Jatropha curcas TaxID=180498 RepID=UPI0005FBAE3F|nr:transmembrane protein 220 [Jatropha curcas]